MPYQNEIKFSLPNTILMKDCIGKRINYKSKVKPESEEEKQQKLQTPKKGQKKITTSDKAETEEERKVPLKEQ